MTTVDTPDWWVGPQQAPPQSLFSYSNGAETSALHTFGPFNCGAFPYLQLHMFSSTAAANVPQYVVRFYADQAMTQQIQSMNIYGWSLVDTYEVIPVMGPWVRVDATFHAGAGTVSANGSMIPLPTSDPMAAAFGDLYLADQINVNIGAGATTTINPSRNRTGRARWVIATTAASWAAQLWGMFPNAGQIALYGVLGTTIAGPASACDVALLSYSPQMQITNNDAAIKAFQASLLLYRW